ncbi:MAG: polynucleotide adenylyltransferase PcnB [Acidobacteriota bacterium]|nr:polynucleotide adenylyltransferase PcnB [Acidobacteriota bacterium]
MTEPVIVPRAEHPISRRDIDADALKVLYRLNEGGYTAYLVGGSVRDLLLSRRPKDFDIGTSAHPYQVKKLFRNCWIIGRRFRLAHVRFGLKAIEVATFRKNIPAGSEGEPAETPPPHATHAAEAADLLIKHDNTFGTPEEDAFRRDFTINALFYDIANFSIIDYVGGLQDLKDGLIRCIGDPNDRFQEDPVRMLRAIVMASRLGFRIDEPVVEAIATHRKLMATASPARLIEEYYKILRSGAAEVTFRALAEHRLLEPVTPEIQRGAKNVALWESLAALDAYRRKFEAAPATMRNSLLLGTLLLPLGLMPKKSHSKFDQDLDDEDEAGSQEAVEESAEGSGNPRKGLPPPSGRSRFKRPPKEPILKIGSLPIARGDTERLRQILSLQGRIADLEMSPKAKRALMHRGPFEDALTWFEIHGNAPAVLEHWKGFIEALGPDALRPPPHEPGAPPAEGRAPGTNRRRRGRRRGRRSFNNKPPES